MITKLLALCCIFGILANPPDNGANPPLFQAPSIAHLVNACLLMEFDHQLWITYLAPVNLAAVVVAAIIFKKK